VPSLAAPLRAPSSTSTSTISYQGRLADTAGNPLTGYYDMRFRIYDSPTTADPLWEEEWDAENSVAVSDGLFNVMLGSINNTLADSIEGHDELYLGIQVDQDSEMEPRVQLGSVPFSMQALTVPDESITTQKIADGAVQSSDIAAGAVQGDHIAEGSVTGAKISGDAITTTHIADGAVVDANLASEKIDKAGDTGIGHLHFPRYRSLYFNYDGSHEARIGGDLGHGPRLYLNGNTEDVFIRPGLHMEGDINMGGNSIINQGAMIEANLQTPEELTAKRIDRFERGDVLCWVEDRLERCAAYSDVLVQAVADEAGKPIVIGAEVIKVLGPVHRGDLLVASSVPGYAIANNSPPPGAVIAQALTELTGGHGLVKAMIRKF
jgi:hypothetical protein